MSRRRPSTRIRGRPHYPSADPTAPGCCRCGLPMTVRNLRHLAEPPATPPEVRAAEARRLGERADDA